MQRKITVEDIRQRDTREVVVRTVDRYGCPAVILFDPEEDERKLPMSRPLKLHVVMKDPEGNLAKAQTYYSKKHPG